MPRVRQIGFLAVAGLAAKRTIKANLNLSDVCNWNCKQPAAVAVEDKPGGGGGASTQGAAEEEQPPAPALGLSLGDGLGGGAGLGGACSKLANL
ncbi:hypothetical protein ACP4OV_006979 [Aristida adscensionis]